MTDRPCARPLLDEADRLAPRDRVHAPERLVENQQLRVVHQRLRQLHALPHALAVAADLLVGRIEQVHRVERRAWPLRAACPSLKPLSRTSAVTHSSPVIRS